MKNRKLVIGMAVIGALLVCCVVIGLFGPKATPLERPTETAVIIVPSPVLETPTFTPQPLPTATPTFEGMIKDILGESNREGVQRIGEFSIGEETFIGWAINDNLTEGLIKSGAQMDVAKILEAIDKSGLSYETVRLEGTFSMVDEYGNVSEDRVVWLVYGRSTVERINWENFLWENVYNIADEAWIHPAFQK